MNTFRVSTLNLWNTYGPWEQRKPVLVQQLKELAPDIIGLQEVFCGPANDPTAENQLVLLANALGYHAAFSAAYAEANGHTGNAILSRWPIVASEGVALPDGGKGEPRCVAYASIDAPFARIPFFSTHLNYKLHDGQTRVEQVRALHEYVVRASAGASFPAILVGDFNAEPESDEVRYLRGYAGLSGPSVYYADCFGVAGQGPGVTFSKDNSFAESWREPERRIDYIFVREPDHARGEPVLATRCFDTALNGVFATDHYGVVATIRIT